VPVPYSSSFPMCAAQPTTLTVRESLSGGEHIVKSTATSPHAVGPEPSPSEIWKGPFPRSQRLRPGDSPEFIRKVTNGSLYRRHSAYTLPARSPSILTHADEAASGL